MVQRHLARLERQRDRIRLVDLDRDLLSAREGVGVVECVDVRQLAAEVACPGRPASRRSPAKLRESAIQAVHTFGGSSDQ